MLEKAEERSQFWACDLAYSKDADLILLDIRIILAESKIKSR